MNHDIKISVIIPCFNVEKFIERTFQQLDQQTYSNFEVIIVNDGSTDGTFEMLARLCKGRLNFYLYSYENAGLSEARNRGLSHATGDYIYFLDADDMFLPNMFEDLVNLIETHNNPDVIVFGFEYVWNNRNLPIISNPKPTGICYSESDIIENFVLSTIGFSDEDLYEYFNNRQWHWKPASSVWRSIYRKVFLDVNGIRFIKGLQLVEDRIFNLTVMAYAKNLVYTENKYYYYIQHQGLLNKINNNPRILFRDKTNALNERDKIRQLYLKLRDLDLKKYYIGTNVLSCLQLAVASTGISFKEGLTLYRNYLSHKTIQDSLKALSTKEAPLKIKIPVMLLKHNQPLVVLLLIRVAKSLGIKANV